MLNRSERRKAHEALHGVVLGEDPYEYENPVDASLRSVLDYNAL